MRSTWSPGMSESIARLLGSFEPLGELGHSIESWEQRQQRLRHSAVRVVPARAVAPCANEWDGEAVRPAPTGAGDCPRARAWLFLRRQPAPAGRALPEGALRWRRPVASAYPPC